MAKVGELELDGSGFNATLRKCNENFEHLGRGMKQSLPILASLAIGFEGLKEAAEAFRGTMEMGATLRDLSLSTGASAHDLVVLRHAFDLAGVGGDRAADFMFKLQQSIAGVNEEGKSTATALKALGLSQDELRNMGAIEQFKALQKGLAGIGNVDDKSAALGDLFGKRMGKDASRVLADPNVLANAQQQAGPTADAFEGSIEVFKELDDSIKSLKINFDGFFVGALKGFAPGVTDLAKAFAGIDFVGIGTAVGEIAKGFTDCAAALIPLINKLAEASKETAKMGMGEMIGKGIGSIVGLGDLGGFIGGLFDPEKKGGTAKPASTANPFKQDFSFATMNDKATVSSLQRVGGGGGFGPGAGDPHLTEARKTNDLLRTISAKLPGRSAAEYHPVPLSS